MLARAVSASPVLASFCVGAVLIAVAAAAAPVASLANTPNRINDLAGRWAGAGTVQWKNGLQQPYKCTVTYFLGDNGARVKQTLRCHSPDDVKIEIATLMNVAGEQITGTWEERLSSMTGTVNGRVTANGYEAHARNEFFNASFEIEMAGACEQQVTLRPSRDIALITANLKKC